jgi:hypothetical protein
VISDRAEPAHAVLKRVRGPAPVDGEDALLGVAAAAHILGEFRAFVVVLASVELWRDATLIRGALLPTAAIRGRQRAFESAHRAWLAEAEGAPLRQLGPPPLGPADRLAGPELVLEDRLGTDFKLVTRALSGAGATRRTEWGFAPGVGRGAQSILITASGLEHLRPLQVSLG